jgi:hypothetical protein
MKRKYRLTESELIRLIKGVIKEEKETVKHLTYTHPYAEEQELDNDGQCTIQIAQKTNNENMYGVVLVCSKYDKPMVVAELGPKSENPKKLKHLICNNLERTYEILDELVEEVDYDELNEDFEYDRYNVIDDPITCDPKLF